MEIYAVIFWATQRNMKYRPCKCRGKLLCAAGMKMREVLLQLPLANQVAPALSATEIRKKS